MNNFVANRRVDVGGVDWERAWHAYEATRPAPGSAEHWSRRAASYGSKRPACQGDERPAGSEPARGNGRVRADGDPLAAELGPYERAFIERSGIRPGETVLDMGCGVGLLAVPLAQMGCRVTCADFSQGMLDMLEKRATKAGVRDMLDLRLLAWDDDWLASGVAPESVDVAISSRSLATYNLTSAMAKLDAVARRRVCVTVASGRSPMKDERAYEAVGRARSVTSDYAYVTNVLFAHGVYPELSYIVTKSLPAFADHDDAFAKLSHMLGDDLDAGEQARLRAFIDAHYVVNPLGEDGRTLEADERREVRWAFVSWGT